MTNEPLHSELADEGIDERVIDGLGTAREVERDVLRIVLLIEISRDGLRATIDATALGIVDALASRV